MLEETTRDVTLEPLDDWIVVEPLDESETASGLIVPINEGAQTRQAIVAAVGPDVESIDPGDKAGEGSCAATPNGRRRPAQRDNRWAATSLPHCGATARSR